MSKVIILVLFLMAVINLTFGFTQRTLCDGMKNVIPENGDRMDVTKKITGEDVIATSQSECIQQCKDAYKKYNIIPCTHVAYIETVYFYGGCKFYNGDLTVTATPAKQRDFSPVTYVQRIADCYSEKEKLEIQKKATSKWKPLQTCVGGTTGPIQCVYTETYGYSKSNTKGTTSSSTSSESTSFSLVNTLRLTQEFRAGVPLATARTSMTASMTSTFSSDFNWSTSTSANQAFTKEESFGKSHEAIFEAGKGQVVTICQPWGSIGPFTVKARVFRRFSTHCCSDNPRDCDSKDQFQY